MTPTVDQIEAGARVLFETLPLPGRKWEQACIEEQRFHRRRAAEVFRAMSAASSATPEPPSTVSPDPDKR